MKISLPLPPTTNHTYYHVRNIKILSKEAKEWREEGLYLLKKCKGKNPTDITVTMYLKRERDVDGSVKLLLDTMTLAGVVVDDRYITDLHLHKRWDKQNPRMEVEF